MKFPIVICAEYTIFLEYFEDVFWFHVNVRKWTPSVKNMMLDDLKKLRDLVRMPLRALVDSENLKLQKFGQHLGWVVELETVLYDGSKAFVYKWS